MIIDADLVNRLERSAAAVTIATVGSMRRIDPLSAAATSALLGGALVSTGIGRYVNRALGIGDAVVTTDDFDELEAFSTKRVSSSRASR